MLRQGGLGKGGEEGCGGRRGGREGGNHTAGREKGVDRAESWNKCVTQESEGSSQLVKILYENSKRTNSSSDRIKGFSVPLFRRCTSRLGGSPG